jgi:SAM-dependent methyltransferase
VIVDRLSLRRNLPTPLKRLASAGLNAIDPLTLRAYRRREGAAQPIPPRALRARVGAPAVPAYVEDGRGAARELETILADHGRPLGKFAAIYEFGCGSGRVLTQLGSASGTKLSGSDVDDQAISWLGAAYPTIDARPNEQGPPTTFEADSFDLVYSISVFTHLNERSQFAWLEEVARLLRPGGIALLTTHGPELFEAYRSGRRPGMTSQQQSALRASPPLDDAGFIFVAEARSAWNSRRYRGVESEYGLAFHSHRYVRDRWSTHLEILDIVPAAINWHQDAVLARVPQR